MLSSVQQLSKNYLRQLHHVSIATKYLVHPGLPVNPTPAQKENLTTLRKYVRWNLLEVQQHAVSLPLLITEVAVVVRLHLPVGDRQHLSNMGKPNQGLVALLDLLLQGNWHLHPRLG